MRQHCNMYYYSMYISILMLMQLATSLRALPRPANTTARIGIVGAGPAGLHMAYLLRSLGYTNVNLVEATDRVGGRAVSLHDEEDDIVHEMGACYLSSDYTELRSLAKWAGHSIEEVSLPPAVIIGAEGQQQSLLSFINGRVRMLLKLGPGPDEQVAAEMMQAAQKYTALHNSLFASDSYEFPLHQPPSFSQLSGSIKQFLVKNDLMALEPLFLLGMTSMGYGSLENTSVMYGMMWMTPLYLQDLLISREQSKLTILAEGYQTLFEKVHAKLNPKIRFNARVVSVRRNVLGKVMVRTDDGVVEFFDWLVWTPSLALTSQLFTDLSEDEERIFGDLEARQFHTQLLRFSPGSSPLSQQPVAYFQENLLRLEPTPTQLWAARNSAAALGKPSSKANNTLVAYFLSDSATDVAGNWPGSQVVQEFKNSYMPRFNIQQMQSGVLWKILHQLQGAKKVWFVGHSVVFDSVKSVMKYNRMLLSLAYPELADRINQL